MKMKLCELQQPGPVSPVRIQSFEGLGQACEITLEAGSSLIDTIAGQLTKANISAAGIVFKDLRLKPMNYVKPTFSNSPEHVAFYSDTYSCAEETEISFATATYGIREGQPFMHCHALWEADGVTQGGHILAPDSIVAKPSVAMVYSASNITLDSSFDKETNFTLFHPVQNEEVTINKNDEKCVIATLRPNIDLIESIESICKKHNICHATIRSGIGSTVGVHFDDGRYIREIPTELVALRGDVILNDKGKYCADIDFALIDAHGAIHKGKLAKGLNPVLICFELIITSVATPIA